VPADRYRIDDELRALLPPIGSGERAALVTSLRRERRCLSPLIVWKEKRLLVDGHHRHDLIEELRQMGIEIALPQIVYKSFQSRLAVIRWMLSFQNARRNWTAADRAAAVLRNRTLVERLRTEARTRMLAGTTTAPLAHATKGGVRRFLSRLAGVGEGTIAGVEKVLSSGNQKVIDDLLVHRKLSLREAKRLVVNAERRARLFERSNLARSAPLCSSEENGHVDRIIHADVLDGLKTVASESVALAFTSPPYALTGVAYPEYRYDGDYGKYLEWLQWVWNEVTRTLRPGGRLVVNCDATNNRIDDFGPGDIVHPVYADIVIQMRQAGLRFYGDFSWFKHHVTNRMRRGWGTYGSCRNPRIRRNHEYILVFSKGSPILEGDQTRCDLTPDEFERWTVSHWDIPPQRHGYGRHPCAFPEALAERVIRLFSYVGDTVLDPFCGSGTVPLVAQNFGRRFIGIDNSEEFVDSARRRLRLSNHKMRC